MLIGAEARGGQRLFPRINGTVGLIGETALCERYVDALALAGRRAKIMDGGVAARGLWRVAQAAGIVE